MYNQIVQNINVVIIMQINILVPLPWK